MRNSKTTQCRWAEAAIQRLLIDRISVRQRTRLARHLMRCKACRHYFRQARRLPGVLASIGPVKPPDGLCEYIQAACAVSAQLPPLPARRPVALRLSVAGVAATIVVAISLAVLHPPRPTPGPMPDRGLVISASRVVAAPQPADELFTTQALSPFRQQRQPARAAAMAPEPAKTKRPRVINLRKNAAPLRPKRRRARVRRKPLHRSAPAIAQSAARRDDGQPAPVAVACAPAAGPVAVVAAYASPPDDVAPEPTATPDSPATAPESSQMTADGMNDAVAVHLAAGMVASALIERYLADAIAERGAELATEDVSAEAGTMAVVSDAVLARDEAVEP